MANNIRVVLEIDNQQYIASINKAEQETKDFATNSTASVNKTTQAFDNLNNKTGAVTAGLGKLKTVLLGAAFLGFARSSLQLADSIDDLREVSGLAVEEIIRFRTALQEGGGSADDAGRAITGFFNKVDEAAQGSAGAQAAFARVGISLQDLATLSERDLLLKTVQGLRNITDPAAKAAVATDLIGKAARGVAIDDKFLNTLEQGSVESEKLSEGIAKAASLNESWERSWDRLRLAFLEAFGPIFEGLSNLLEQIPALTTAFKVLGAVIVGVFVASGLRSFISLLGMASRGVAAIADGFGKIRSMGGLGKALSGAAQNKGIGGLRDAASAVGIVGGAGLAATSLFGADDETVNKEEKKNETLATGARAVTDAFQKQKDEISAIGEAYSSANSGARDKIGRDIAMLNMTDDMKETYQALWKSLDDQAKVEENLNSKRIKGNTEVNNKIDAQIATVKRQGEEFRTQLADELSGKQKILQAEILKNRLLEGQRDLQEKIAKLQEDYELQGLTGTSRKLREIEIQELRIYRAKLAQFDLDNAKLPIDERMRKRKEFADLETKLTKQAINEQQQAVKKADQNARSFQSGWRRAFEAYADNATNAAIQAEQIFNKITKGMEDSIVNFVKTGKFEFKSFVADLLETLLRSQIQQTIAGIFNPKGSLGGSLGGLGDALSGLLGGGGASPGSSANNPLYVMDISGGGGFMGPMQQPQQGGGSALGSLGNIASGVWDAVSSVGDFIGDLFGGFRANGGPVSGGKSYMVGERGPELFTPSGSGSISPNGGFGGTNVTYNINAVDAASFKQLVASDPGFIHAVAMQGAGSIPRRR